MKLMERIIHLVLLNNNLKHLLLCLIRILKTRAYKKTSSRESVNVEKPWPFHLTINVIVKAASIMSWNQFISCLYLTKMIAT